ncbi:alpha/beta fold hydrolase [Dongia deserti]|uniref:alpha/beta fold hydrolase n=1 Tax=Dongia deserti TaxID=2268030 RepID=UPI000E65DA67|nr:alpha/beta fold hydrolase [Dongia deserti]
MCLLSTLLAAVLGTAVTLAPAFGAERWQRLPSPPAMPVSVAAGYAPVIHMYYAVYGAGDPVLLIHGGLGHANIWASQVKDLSRDHMVIVADSRGHGRSTRNDQPYSYELMASDYLALLDYLKVDKVALVGWSDGGIIGLDIAMKHPERLSKLFAHAANATVDGLAPDVMENKIFNAYIEKCGEDYQKLSKTPDQYDAFVEQLSHMWETQPAYSDAELARITVPTAIVLGDHDEAITRKHTDHLAAVIPGAKEVILRNTSHFAMLQDPAGYNKAVRDFLAE